MPKDILDLPIESPQNHKKPDLAKRLLLYGIHFICIAVLYGALFYVIEEGRFGEGKGIYKILWGSLVLIPAVLLVLLCKHAFSLKLSESFASALVGFCFSFFGTIVSVRFIYDSGFIFNVLGVNPRNDEATFLATFAVSIVVYCFFIMVILEFGAWFFKTFQRRKRETSKHKKNPQ